MPHGDGTGPVWARPGIGWPGGRGWCRGAGQGFGGHGWRNAYLAAGRPGWMRWDPTEEPLRSVRRDAHDERGHLERYAEMLDDQLRRVRARLEDLADTGAAGS